MDETAQCRDHISKAILMNKLHITKWVRLFVYIPLLGKWHSKNQSRNIPAFPRSAQLLSKRVSTVADARTK